MVYIFWLSLFVILNQTQAIFLSIISLYFRLEKEDASVEVVSWDVFNLLALNYYHGCGGGGSAVVLGLEQECTHSFRRNWYIFQGKSTSEMSFWIMYQTCFTTNNNKKMHSKTKFNLNSWKPRNIRKVNK